MKKISSRPIFGKEVSIMLENDDDPDRTYNRYGLYTFGYNEKIKRVFAIRKLRHNRECFADDMYLSYKMNYAEKG